MDWWKPDPQTRRALRRWTERNPVKRERPPRWRPEDEFDQLECSEAETTNPDTRPGSEGQWD